MLRNVLVCKSIFVLVDYKKVCDFFLGPPFRKTVVDDFFFSGPRYRYGGRYFEFVVTFLSE